MGNHGVFRNIHVPQSLETRAELELLSATKYHFVSAQGSKPNIAIVQDSLLGGYLMTRNMGKLTKSQFYDITMCTTQSVWNPDRIKTIARVLKAKGKKPDVYNGAGLVSLILPDDFIYEKKNNANPDEPVVKIFRGVMYEGTLDKTILGASHNSLIQVLHKEYGVDVAADFVSNILFVTY